MNIHQNFPVDAAASGGDGTGGDREQTFEGAGRPGLWHLGEDPCPVGRTLHDEGSAGMAGRSSRPGRMPGSANAATIERIITLRRQRLTGQQWFN